MAHYPKEYSTTGPLSKLYRTWYDMCRRCNTDKAQSSRYYYHKGIGVCKDWLYWPIFAEWSVDNGWHEGLEIDRVNNQAGYNPSNCRFVTHVEQNRNRDLMAAHKGIREGQTRRWSKLFVCVDTGEVFETQIEAQRKYGVDRKSLRYALSGKYKQAGGYSWRYMEAS